MTAQTLSKDLQSQRSKRLKTETSDTHDRLDKSIMRHEPFSSRRRYTRFLAVQYLFHREIDALYGAPVLSSMIPDLQARRRLDLIAQDVEDLGFSVPSMQGQPMFRHDRPVDIPYALGWLYVAEGSNLGAAFLLKAAAKLGLSEEFGARHLAGSPEGRGLHWRNFTAALDAASISPDDEERVIAGAKAAFSCVYRLVEEKFTEVSGEESR